MTKRICTLALLALVFALSPGATSVIAADDENANDPAELKMHETMPAELKKAVELVEEYHVSGKKLDDAISVRWLDRFIGALDPKKMHFLRTDIDEFRKHRKRLDDDARAGRIDFSEAVFARYRERVTRSTKWAEEFVVATHDFDSDEEATLRHADWAGGSDALKERWRKRIKLELLTRKLSGLDRESTQKQLVGRFRRIRTETALMNVEDRTALFIDQLLKSFDAHSAYFSPTELDDFRQ